jgi:Predicted Zn-dependent hydrolases of the beta-lactamase fold
MIFQQIRSATIKITYGGKRFLIDPWLADKGAFPPIPSPFNESRNPLVDLPLPIVEITNVEAVIVTHMHHFDHFDESARKALSKKLPIFTQNEKEADDMRGLGFQKVAALQDEGVAFEGMTLFHTYGEHGQGEAAKRNYDALGLPEEACGVVFAKPGEPTVYVAGDTVWCDKVKEAIGRHQPDVVILNAAQAAFHDNTPILMGVDGVHEVAKAAPQAVIIASHMDAVNHARLTRKDLKQFIDEKGLASQVKIPLDGETYTF